MSKKMTKLMAIIASLVVGFCCILGGCTETKKNDTDNGNENSGTQNTLPDYDGEKDSLAVLFGGWVMPADLTAEQITYIKESGITVLEVASAGSSTLNIDFSNELSAKDKNILNICEENGFKVLAHVVGKNASSIANAKNLKDYNAIMGICYDEPTKSQIQEIASYVDTFNSTAGNKSLFVNLFPSTASSVKTDFSDYKSYLEYYCNNVLEKLTVGEKWLSADRYVLTYDTKGEKCLDTGWLADVEAVALTAEKYTDVKTNFFIQTMPYGGNANSGSQVDSRDRIPTYEDIRLQEYTLLAFGYDMISCFCYYSPAVGTEFLERQTAMIDRSGNKTDIYNAVQKVNQEILSFDHVIKQFKRVGAFTNDAGTTTSGKSRSNNSSFSSLTNRMSLESIDSLNSVTTSADTLFGYFMDDKDNTGFMVVNYNETSKNITDTVTLNFNSSYKFTKAQCYVGGEKIIVDVKDNAVTLTLGAGEGVFVIPY